MNMVFTNRLPAGLFCIFTNPFIRSKFQMNNGDWRMFMDNPIQDAVHERFVIGRVNNGVVTRFVMKVSTTLGIELNQYC